MAWDAKNHPNTKPRGKRDPKTCKVQTGGHLVFIQNGQPHFWSDRPLKFRAHIRHILDWHVKRGRPVELTDIKWKQLGSETYWRIPEWPDGNASVKL